MRVIQTITCAVLVFLLLLVLVAQVDFFPVHAQGLTADRMIVNGIPMKNLVPEDSSITEVTFYEDEDQAFLFYPATNEFWIHILGSPYATVRPKAESRFLSELDVSRNESCFLDISVMTPRSANPDVTTVDYGLPYCSGPMQADLNADERVNGIDLSQCFADLESSDEDLLCDFNVNRRIDALDLSIVIQHFGGAVPERSLE